MAAPTTDVERLPHALRASPGFLLGKAAQQGSRLLEQVLGPLGLKGRDYGVFVSLRDLGPLSQHELSELLRIDRTTMVAIIDHLQQLGFVVRGIHPTDRRTHEVQLTSAGQAAVEQARTAVAAADAALVERLSARQGAQLVRLLQKLCALD